MAMASRPALLRVAVGRRANCNDNECRAGRARPPLPRARARPSGGYSRWQGVCTAMLAANNGGDPASAPVLEAAAAAPAGTPELDARPFAALDAWLKSKGAVHDCAFVDLGGAMGAGAVAARPLAPGERFFSLPLESMTPAGAFEPLAITTELVRAQGGALAPLGRALAFTGAEADLRRVLGRGTATPGFDGVGVSLLACALLHIRARGEGAPFAAYVAALPGPETLDSPLLWTESQLTELTGSRVLAKIEERREAVVAAREALFPVLEQLDIGLFGPERVSDADWDWAWVTAQQRAVALPQRGVTALVPGLDMLNHRAGAPVLELLEPPGAAASLASARWSAPLLTLRAGAEGVPEGGQLFHDYADHTITGSLLEYGFLDLDALGGAAAADGGPVDLELDLSPLLFEFDGLNAARLESLAANGLCAAPWPLIRYDPAKGEDAVTLPPGLLPLARGLVLSAESLSRRGGSPYLWRPLDEPNERAAGRAVLACVRSALAAYPTSVYDDERLLADLLSQQRRGGVLTAPATGAGMTVANSATAESETEPTPTPAKGRRKGEGGKKAAKGQGKKAESPPNLSPSLSQSLSQSPPPSPRRGERLLLAVAVRLGEKRALEATAELLTRAHGGGGW